MLLSPQRGEIYITTKAQKVSESTVPVLRNEMWEEKEGEAVIA